MLEGCINSRDYYGGGKEKGEDPFEIFRRLIRDGWKGRRARRCNFGQDDFCARVSTKRTFPSLPAKFVGVIAGGKIIARPNKSYLLTFHVSLFQIQVYGYNAELYHNMSEAQHKSQGLVAISLMVQVR